MFSPHATLLASITEAAVTAIITHYLRALERAGGAPSVTGLHLEALRYGLSSAPHSAYKQHMSPAERVAACARAMRYVSSDTRALQLLWLRYSASDGFFDSASSTAGKGKRIVTQRRSVRPTYARIAALLDYPSERAVRLDLSRVRARVARALAEDLELGRSHAG